MLKKVLAITSLMVLGITICAFAKTWAPVPIDQKEFGVKIYTLDDKIGNYESVCILTSVGNDIPTIMNELLGQAKSLGCNGILIINSEGNASSLCFVVKAIKVKK
jgi:hypothetical protein